MDACFQFYYDMHEKVLHAVDRLIDLIHIREDLGTQISQVIDLDIFERHFAPKFKKYFDVVHSYGAKTMIICVVV